MSRIFTTSTGAQTANSGFWGNAPSTFARKIRVDKRTKLTGIYFQNRDTSQVTVKAVLYTLGGTRIAESNATTVNTNTDAILSFISPAEIEPNTDFYIGVYTSVGRLETYIAENITANVSVTRDGVTFTFYPSTFSSTSDVAPNGSTVSTSELSIGIEFTTNNLPTLNLASPTDNQTLSGGSTYTLEGTASDPDNGNAVTVKYAINGGTARNITSAISDGSTAIPFSKALTFQNGRLYDGGTDVSGPLAENTTYTVSVYAVDDQGGTSTAITRSFTVILNRPPTINLDPYNANRTGVSELETLTFAGTVTDPENDNVSLTVAVNGGAPVTLKSGVASGTAFSYSIPVSSLVFGANTITFVATDVKGASTTKALTVNKAGSLAPVKTAVVRYVITPPLGSAAEIAAWVQREDGDLTIDAAASIVGSADPETYVALTKNASVPLGDGTIVEDEFVGAAAQPGAKVALRLTFTRENTSSTAAVKKIMGGIG
ncbi:hypothetical protein A6764_22195 [Brevibacillus sp. WF146]|uniref:Ig-like domain-containing protein n=1 Tax=Brevibacillus sp. WF146 TaxID=319501 RepID=UPI0007EC5FD0|nr:hypothetical protein [Brevibacillus sp. WF146]UYZ12133.1 hypothetical protein A6764_15000 [Brevibacillus sp. WF146]UYZ13420.1 hypothetical protein A6764_22195 [Brevibacillus sp. WF146]